MLLKTRMQVQKWLNQYQRSLYSSCLVARVGWYLCKDPSPLSGACSLAMVGWSLILGWWWWWWWWVMSAFGARSELRVRRTVDPTDGRRSYSTRDSYRGVWSVWAPINQARAELTRPRLPLRRIIITILVIGQTTSVVLCNSSNGSHLGARSP